VSLVTNLTGTQRRILEYLAIDGRWISLKEIDNALRVDDIVAVPSLIECGLIEHRVGMGTVRITAAGKAVMGMS
jgi:hypothetical protein